MNEGLVMEVFSEAMLVSLKLVAPVLIISVLVGLVVAVLQAATQVHEQTLSFAPKLIAIALVLLLAGPWMLEQIRDFTTNIFQLVAIYA